MNDKPNRFANYDDVALPPEIIRYYPKPKRTPKKKQIPGYFMPPVSCHLLYLATQAAGINGGFIYWLIRFYWNLHRNGPFAREFATVPTEDREALGISPEVFSRTLEKLVIGGLARVDRENGKAVRIIWVATEDDLERAKSEGASSSPTDLERPDPAPPAS